ncbi:hypothetical protein ACFY7H_13100 [Streptomyces sp. NPDC012794]|uniref:hypothetical protein n=1 Tax=Streptomyces sp. NPDC012794 TaxID=3364850 RepID=UPI003697AE8D
MATDPWLSSFPSSVVTFTPTLDDMESEHYGLFVSSLGGEDTDGELIVVGADLTLRRALAAMAAHARTVCSWDGYDAVAELRDRINGGDFTVAITSTLFVREADGGWSLQRRADGQPAAWLVSPWHPAAR